MNGAQPAGGGTGAAAADTASPAAADTASPAASGALPHGTAGPDAGGSRPGSRARRLLRAGLVLLAVIQAGQGAWQYFAPRSFYDVIPTVAADPPFNGHLLTDVGGLNLALAVVLAAAAWRLDRALARVALAAYLVYSGSHLAFHATDQAQLTTGQRVFLITSLSLLPVLAAALLGLSIRGGRAARPGDAGQPHEAAPRATGRR